MRLEGLGIEKCKYLIWESNQLRYREPPFHTVHLILIFILPYNTKIKFAVLLLIHYQSAIYTNQIHISLMRNNGA
jgi:hypothetical protein